MTKRQITKQLSKLARGARRAAFAALALLAAAATVLGPFYSVIWWETARACVETYFRGEADAPTYATNLTLGWSELWSFAGQRELFTKLDISSVSAGLLAAFFFALAISGWRNTLWLAWRSRQQGGYFHAIYPDYAIFPESFDLLAVRLGLLGTLLSFLLAAIAHLAPDDAAGESSQAIFFLLCASLTSTFVGCTVAYLFVPLVNWLNDLATGFAFIEAGEADTREQQFVERLDSLLGGMQRLDGTLAAMATTAEQFHELSLSMSSSRQSFDDLLRQLQAATTNFQIVASEFSDLRSTLIPHLERVAKLPDRFVKPLDRFEEAAAAVQSAAQSSQTAFAQLEGLARDTSPTITLVGRVIDSSLAIVENVRHSLTALEHTQSEQSAAIRPLPDMFLNHRRELEHIRRQLAHLSTINNGSPPKPPPARRTLWNLLRRAVKNGADG